MQCVKHSFNRLFSVNVAHPAYMGNFIGHHMNFYAINEFVRAYRGNFGTDKLRSLLTSRISPVCNMRGSAAAAAEKSSAAKAIMMNSLMVVISPVDEETVIAKVQRTGPGLLVNVIGICSRVYSNEGMLCHVARTGAHQLSSPHSNHILLRMMFSRCAAARKLKLQVT